jgi:hypothetical protein
MTAPLIAPLIPPRARLDGREHGRSATARLPPPRVLTVPDGVVYGFGRMPLLAAIRIWLWHKVRELLTLRGVSS